MENKITKFFGNALITAILLFPIASYAEVKEIISEGTYNMGDGETPNAAESQAVLQAKRTALEQAGTYVASYSKVKNFQLTEDEIQVLASGIMEVDVLDKKRTIVGDGFNFWVKIKARVSTDKMEAMVKRVKDESILEDYKKIQEAYDKIQKENQELKKQLAATEAAKGKEEIEVKIAANEKLFQANEWFDKGYQYDFKKEYDEAVSAYTSGIDLNPNEPIAYYNRGIAYYSQGRLDRAIEDYQQAIALNQNYAKAYNNRGNAYADKGQLERAIEDYHQAIFLKPDHAEYYYNRGNNYRALGDYEQAIKDYNKAIELNPQFAAAYNNRGAAYGKLGNYQQTIEDLKTAARLGSVVTQDYLRINGIHW